MKNRAARTATAERAQARQNRRWHERAVQSGHAEPEEQQATWAELLTRAVNEPGVIHEAYHRFWNYSLGNQLLALIQCYHRGIEPGPIGTFQTWLDAGRPVKKGEKALVLCQPRLVKRNGTDDAGEPVEVVFAAFHYAKRWFVLAQTEGAEYQPPPIPGWDRERALSELNVTRIPFDSPNGNAQGYSYPDRRELAINPVAFSPDRTLLHELAHILLNHKHEERKELWQQAQCELEAEGVAYLACYALELGGGEYSRGYLQHWLTLTAHHDLDGKWQQQQGITEEQARRIFKTVDQILKAGRIEPE